MTTPAPPPRPQGSSSGPRVTRDQVRDLNRLRRARDGRMVAGVCEGLSRHLDVDPLLIRVIFGALTVFGGAGLIIYGIAWFTIPEEDSYDSAASRMLHQDPERTMSVGLALGGIAGVVTLLGAIGFSTPRPWAVITVSIVALVLFTVLSRRGQTQPRSSYQPPPYAPPGDPQAPAPSSDPAADAEPAEPEPAESEPTVPLDRDAASPGDGDATNDDTSTSAPGSALVASSTSPADQSVTAPIPTMPIPTTHIPTTAPTMPIATVYAETVTPEQRAQEERAWWQRPDTTGGYGGPGAPLTPGPPPPPPTR